MDTNRVWKEHKEKADQEDYVALVSQIGMLWKSPLDDGK